GVSSLGRISPWFDGMPTFAEVMPECEISATQVCQALKGAGETAPGSDGEVGVEVLVDAPQAVVAEGSDETVMREYGSGDNRLGSCEFNGSSLALFPKKPAGQDPAAGVVFAQPDTRPLMLADTSNQLLASALRYAIEPAIEGLAGASQRVIFRGRSISANAIDREASVQAAVLDDNMTYALLFDKRVALPSLEYDYLYYVLDKLGLPRGVRAAIRAFYAGQRRCLAVAGHWWEGVAIAAGTRQGRPLSPRLFVLVAEPFNRQLGAVEADHGRGRDCAACSGLHFAAAPGLHLNVAITALLPPWTRQPRAAADARRQAAPAYGAARAAHPSTYPGFEVGPAAADSGWDAPVRKFREAVCTRAGRAQGVHLATLGYGAFAIPKLQHTAPFHEAPPEWPALERWALSNGSHLRSPSICDDFQMSHQLQSLITSGPAAQLRAAIAGGGHRQRIWLDEMRNRLQRARYHAIATWDVDWRWQNWFTGGPAQRLQVEVDDLGRQGVVTGSRVLDQGLDCWPRPVTLATWRRSQKRTQASAATLLRRWHWRLIGFAALNAEPEISRPGFPA
ncbi:unnamed protein product, partial [Prorocentrum cordatum]